MKPGPSWGRLNEAETKFLQEAKPEFLNVDASDDPQRVITTSKFAVLGQGYGRSGRGEQVPIAQTRNLDSYGSKPGVRGYTRHINIVAVISNLYDVTVNKEPNNGILPPLLNFFEYP